jgi:adenosylcobinamide kinase/adenosylcobinamide-phosphate guanylyltransferase
MGQLTLILGGARSGKSTYAEELARESNKPVLFIATATAFDDEMRERIKNHQASRPANWTTLEAQTNIAAELVSKVSRLWSLQNRDAQALQSTVETWNGIVILDCITLLMNNILLPLPEDVSFDVVMQKTKDEIESLIAVQKKVGGDWLVISNEVGLGLVPPYPLGRIYRDALGRANQMLAKAADHVILMVVGIPMTVK